MKDFNNTVAVLNEMIDDERKQHLATGILAAATLAMLVLTITIATAKPVTGANK